jgi:hypothetical protein
MNRYTTPLVLAVIVSGCGKRSSDPSLFTRLDPSTTGVTFANNLTEEPGFNIVEYLYY